MKTEKIHTIEKILVEVNTRKVNSANSIKNNIDRFLQNDLFPKIESVLTMADQENALLRINQLNIHISLPVNSDFSNPSSLVSAKIEEQVRHQIFAEIGDILTVPVDNETWQNQYLTQQENQEQIFLYFLEKGHYPWYGNRSHINSFVDTEKWTTSFANPVFIEKLKITVKKQGVFQRFVFQFPFEMVYRFLSHINSGISENSTFLHEIDNTFQPLLKANLLNSLFLISIENEPRKIVVVIQKMLQQLFDETEKAQRAVIRVILKTTPKSIFETPEFHNMVNNLPHNQKKYTLQTLPSNLKTALQKRKFEIRTDENGFDFRPEKLQKNADFFENDLSEIHIQNAGLILIHPFFRNFFRLLNLLNQENQILQDKKYEAVQILHFLATGEEEFDEGDLVIAKFICGLPLNFSIPKQSLITSAMKLEAEVLLNETIKNWPALKNTSPAGLRQMFLQRNGKLVQKKQRFKLVMERKAQDVLLEKLSWNVSLVQLPWRNELLTVDW